MSLLYQYFEISEMKDVKGMKGVKVREDIKEKKCMRQKI